MSEPPLDGPTAVDSPHDRTRECRSDGRTMKARALVGVELAGRYRIDQLISVGGMGAVFVAQHLGLNTRVAVKVPHVSPHQPVLLERFEREARRAASISHPGVARVFDFQVDPEHGAFLAMELLQGETLSERLRRAGRFPLSLALSTVRSVLDALAQVHEQGLVHRDLKPSNIFLAGPRDAPTPKLIDFGIAKAVAMSGASLTIPGAMVGTLRFMAPEQALQKVRVDGRADIYSMGAVLMTLLTGRPPFLHKEMVALTYALTHEEAPSLRTLAPHLPPYVIKAVDFALRTDRERRFSSAAAFRRALEEPVRTSHDHRTRPGWAELPTPGSGEPKLKAW